MEQVGPPRRALPTTLIPHSPRRLSILLSAISVTLLFLVLRYQLQASDIPLLLMIAVAAAFGVVIFLGTRSLIRARGEHNQSTERFQQMAGNIREIFWMIDVRSRKALFVNEAYEAITGRSRQSLMDNPMSYAELIHPHDRDQVLTKLEAATRTGQFNERFRIVCTHGQVRWVRVHGFPVRDHSGRIHRLVGTAQEITEQKEAEDEVARNLAAAESARAEAEALGKATLGLTEDIRMDFVLGSLLQSLADLIPYTCARVLVSEGGPHVLSLKERLFPEPLTPSPEYPLTLNANESLFLKHLLDDQKSVLLSDTRQEELWATFKQHHHLRSWISVPLVASEQYLGFLSVGHVEPNRFTEDHLRRAQLLAVPAAAAIQNSRLYECARIYGEELEKRIDDLRQAQAALVQSEEGRRISEDKFQKVFRSSPIPFSITSLAEGRFLDVNAAFEHRYGYSRGEVLGRTVHELTLWEHPSDRSFMLTQLERGPVRNVITRLRAKSGEIKITTYSADKIQFDGQTCILAVSEDLPGYPGQLSN